MEQNDIKKLYYLPSTSYKVVVRCFTYNHKNYISEALNSFAMQETTFPYACLVVDDCSTDGAQSVINSWIDEHCEVESISADYRLGRTVIAHHKSNQNCIFYFYLFNKNVYTTGEKEPLVEEWRKYCTYEAICEGDDYWITKDKLQEQVDLLDNNSNYSLSATNAQNIFPDSSLNEPFSKEPSRNITLLSELVDKRQFHTASVLFRTKSLLSCEFRLKGSWDTFNWCCLATQGPIHYDAKITCAYRKEGQGVTESTPTIDWLVLISEWGDILVNTFAPKYVNKNLIVRSISSNIIKSYIHRRSKLTFEEKTIARELYMHNFSVLNVMNDLKTFIKEIVKLHIKY